MRHCGLSAPNLLKIRLTTFRGRGARLTTFRKSTPRSPVLPVVIGCAPPSTRRAIRVVSSSVDTASRRSSSVAPSSLWKPSRAARSRASEGFSDASALRGPFRAVEAAGLETSCFAFTNSFVGLRTDAIGAVRDRLLVSGVGADVVPLP